jgi:hypothetical protein
VRPRSVAFAYPALLFLLVHGWFVLYGLSDQGWLAHGSYVIQQLSIFTAYVALDSLLERRSLRFALAIAAAAYVAFIHLDALLIEVVGLSSYRALIMFAAGGAGSLHEIGLGVGRLALLVIAILAGLVAAGFLHRRLDRYRIEVPAFAPLAIAALPVVFAGEQRLSRDADGYVYRSIDLPGYLQLFDTTARSFDLPLEHPSQTIARHMRLSEIGPPKNPKHVLLILLESVRADAITPESAPTLHALSRSSLDFTNAYTEAIFTPLAWNVLLLDRPAHMFMWPRAMMAPHAAGSWPLHVLDSAGYRIWISSSTDLDYGHFLPFLLGDGELVDRLEIVRDATAERWQRDDRATATLVDWIHSASFDRPTFMLLQLDSTHWTYQFPPGAAVVEPYSEPLDMPVPLTTEEEFRLLHNRYLNCVHHVDAKIASVLTAIGRRGLDDDTAVIVVSDHGEGFTPGIQGHAVLCEATTRIPLMMRLPGVEPARIAGAVSFRNVFPTLFDYLELDSLDPSSMLGRSALPPARAESEILMFSPDGRRADLRLADGSRLRFNVRMRETVATFTPLEKIDDRIPWREMLERRMSAQQERELGEGRPLVGLR